MRIGQRLDRIVAFGFGRGIGDDGRNRTRGLAGGHARRNVGSGDYFGGGRVYLINNTVWKSATGSLVSAFVSELDEENRIDNYRVFNNVIQVYQPDQKYGLREAHAVSSQFDHDVVLGKTSFSSEQETHGALGTPTFAGTGFDEATHTGTFYLADDSLGAGTGKAFPNLTPAEPVDAGAHQRGAPPLSFGP